MKNLCILFALLGISLSVFAQDPILPKETEVVEPAPCETYFRAAYQAENQTLLIKYEDCGADFAHVGFCGVGWCGNISEGEYEAMNQEFGVRHLLVSNLQGVTQYTQEIGLWTDVPNEIKVNDIQLQPGVYVVRLNTYNNGEKVTLHTKFVVR